MTDGLELSPEARRALSGGDGSRPLTLAEYATTSGIGLRLDGIIWVNAPISEHNPNFVERPIHRLEFHDEVFSVRSGSLEVEAKPVPVPDYYNRSNRRGEKYTSYAVTHTDRVRISPIEGCAIACQFCDLTYKFRYRQKSVEGLIESIEVALSDVALPARHILISGGTPRPADYEYENEVYSRVSQAFPDIEVDVMMMPMSGLLDPLGLRLSGVQGLSVNLEIYNEECAKKLVSAKWKLGRERILHFIARAVEVFGQEQVRSLLVVGLEPMEDTLRGVEALAQRGCQPVLSPFRPDPSTPLRNHPLPQASVLVEIYERSAEIVSRYGIHLGPKCVPCHHNTLSFPDESGYYVRADY